MMPPQPSPAKPQLALTCAQLVYGVHLGWPQRPATPPPPQVSPATVQFPQFRVPPQPSPIMPQFALSAVHVVGVQVPPPLPQTNGVPPPPQVSPAFVQVPQLTVPLQPSDSSPQLALIAPHASVAVLGVQPPDEPPHWKKTPPPPQVWGAVQVPQSIVPPWPSLIRPQLALTAAQLAAFGSVLISSVAFGSVPASTLSPPTLLPEQPEP